MCVGVIDLAVTGGALWIGREVSWGYRGVWSVWSQAGVSCNSDMMADAICRMTHHIGRKGCGSEWSQCSTSMLTAEYGLIYIGDHLL